MIVNFFLLCTEYIHLKLEHPLKLIVWLVVKQYRPTNMFFVKSCLTFGVPNSQMLKKLKSSAELKKDHQFFGILIPQNVDLIKSFQNEMQKFWK